MDLLPALMLELSELFVLGESEFQQQAQGFIPGPYDSLLSI